MGLYTPTRRRAILLLLLTSALLLTLDARGSSIVDGARTGFRALSEPLQNAGEVISRPIVNTWQGITDYSETRAENDRLRAEVERQRTTEIQHNASLIEYEELRRLNNLPAVSDLPRVVATVVGVSPSNLDQVIEIDRGSDSGISIGNAVVANDGLVGRVTRVDSDRAWVLLASDENYSVEVKINPAPPPTTTTTAPDPNAPTTDPNAPTTTVDPNAPTTTVDPNIPTTATPGQGALPNFTTTTLPPPPTITVEGFIPDTTATPTTLTPETTVPPEPATGTTVPLDAVRDTGVLHGSGPGRLPQTNLLSDSGTYGAAQVGDPVLTAGGTFSLAPPDIPVGTVRHVVNRSASDGPLLEIDLAVDLDQLYYVAVVLYKPISETDPTAIETPGAN